MRRVFGGAAAMLLGLASACSPAQPGNQAADASGAGAKAMDHLRCAAMISAADKLMFSGALPADPAFNKASLVAAMTHLNAYSIPRRMKEAEAFAAVNAERTRIMAETSPARILEEAKACIERVPGL